MGGTWGKTLANFQMVPEQVLVGVHTPLLPMLQSKTSLRLISGEELAQGVSSLPVTTPSDTCGAVHAGSATSRVQSAWLAQMRDHGESRPSPTRMMNLGIQGSGGV